MPSFVSQAHPRLVAAVALTALSVAAPASAQHHPHAAFIMPQRPLTGGVARVLSVDVRVRIDGPIATTSLDIDVQNPGARPLNARLLVPVPVGATVRGFDFRGAAAEPTATLLDAAEARRTYDDLVRRVIDPGLLEFVGLAALRSSVFPVPPRGLQTVRIVYEQLLEPRAGGRLDYELPRSITSEVAAAGVKPPKWSVTVAVATTQPLSAVYSPTHTINTERRGARNAVASSGELKATGPFRLSVLPESGLGASTMLYPAADGSGGYFLMLGGLPNQQREALRRELILVLDRSGSMRGERIDAVRRAARAALDGLRPTDRFNVVTFNHAAAALANGPVPATPENVAAARRFVDDIRPLGGTNLFDGMRLATQTPPTPGLLPMVLLVSDGLPTVGSTDEATIRRLSGGGRRWFTVGVGTEVNAPLLEALSVRSRGRAEFAVDLPSLTPVLERVVSRLEGPTLADLSLTATEPDASGSGRRDVSERLSDVVPVTLPDLFGDDTLVVMGRYSGSAPMTLRVGGESPRGSVELTAALSPADADVRLSFVPRLWASRQIAVLSDAIREIPADRGTGPAKELIAEIVRLSKEFGVLTEYTAFFAADGTDLARPADLMATTTRNYLTRAQTVRSGRGAVNQSLNLTVQRRQVVLNNDNAYVDENLTVRRTDGVRQVADRTFYRQNGRWVDSRLIGQAPAPARVLNYGERALNDAATRLASAGRQATLSLPGDTLTVIDGRTVLIKNPN